MHEMTAESSSICAPNLVSASAYLSPAFAGLEKERLWARVWQLACREEDIPRVGDFVEYAIFDESVLIVRIADDRIKAFFNACQHRGRRLRDEPEGHLSQFYCRFHGWKYHLDGSIAYVHNREDWEACAGFKDSELSLKECSVDTWAGWVWVNFDKRAESLKSFLGVVPDFLDPFELHNSRILWSARIHAPVNWKVTVEAFIEGYHSFATHFVAGVNYKPAKFPGQVKGLHAMFTSSFADLPHMKNAQGTWQQPADARQMIGDMYIGLNKELKAMILEPGLKAAQRLLQEVPVGTPPDQVMNFLWQFHQTAFADAGILWPEHLTQSAVERAGVDWHIFPNNVCLPTIDGALWYRSRPAANNDPTASIFDIYCLGRVPDGTVFATERRTFADFDSFVGNNPFLEEDFANMVAVQKGMASRGWANGARTNPVQEVQIANFHQNIGRYLHI